MLVGGEFLDKETLCLHGILEDQLYAMEIEMDVRIPDGIVAAIRGWMKRYTTPVCPKALDVLQKIVGISLREEGWVSKVNREIGQKGCRHLAEIMIECGRCLDSARMAKDIQETLKGKILTSSSDVTRSWVNEHMEVQGTCMARP
jgi:hypothetical protein